MPYVAKPKEVDPVEQRNPYLVSNDEEEDTPETMDQPCLVPFTIWRETGVSILPSALDQGLAQVSNEASRTILDTNTQEECEEQDGIVVDDVCHYYQVLKQLCLKVSIDTE